MAGYYKNLVYDGKKNANNFQQYVANAGSYVRNLLGNISPVIPKIGDYYGQIYDAKEKVRDGINDWVADGIRAGVDMLPDNIEQPIERVGGYVDRLVGGEGIEKALSFGENLLARKLLGPVATADRIYGIFREAGQKNDENNAVTVPHDGSGSAPIVNEPVQPGNSEAEPMSPTQSPVRDKDVQRSYVASGGDGGKVNITSYEDYIGEGKYESTAGKYNADVDYAQGIKNDAYKEAEDAYRIAMRDADANYRTSLPTYGSAAEEMLDKGLSRSGYTEYLMGKALEAKSDEAMAARSQMSYQKMLADKEYKADVKNALDERFKTELALDEEYKSKVVEVVNGIMDGLWDASVGERILAQYAPSSGVSAEIRAALSDAQSTYDTATNGTVLGAYINWCNANDVKINQATMIDYLKSAGKFTDGQISAYIGNVFDGDGNFLGTGGDNVTINPEPKPGDGETNTGGNNVTINPDPEPGDGETNTGGNNATIDPDPEPNVNPSTGLTYDTALDALETYIDKDVINNDEEWQTRINTLRGGEGIPGNQKAYNHAQALKDGLIVTGGKVESNDGLRKDYSVGDNFEIKFDGKIYRVESEGSASDEVVAIANNITNGKLFSYKSELYVKVNGTVKKVRARRLFGNGDYDKLWRAVFHDAVDSLRANKDNLNYDPASDLSIDKTTVKNLEIEHLVNDATIENRVGDWLKVWIGDMNYKVKLGDQVFDDAILAAAKKNDLSNGALFIIDDELYIKYENGVYTVESRWLMPNQDDYLMEKVGRYENDGSKGIFGGGEIITVVDNKFKISGITDSNGELVVFSTRNAPLSGAGIAAEYEGVKKGQLFKYLGSLYVYMGDKKANKVYTTSTGQDPLDYFEQMFNSGNVEQGEQTNSDSTEGNESDNVDNTDEGSDGADEGNGSPGSTDTVSENTEKVTYDKKEYWITSKKKVEDIILDSESDNVVFKYNEKYYLKKDGIVYEIAIKPAE